MYMNNNVVCHSVNIYPMNTLNISIPYSYAVQKAELNWYDILFSINNGFLPYDAAIEHAQYELDIYNRASQNVLNLAVLSLEKTFPHSIHPYIDELANEVPQQSKEASKSKLLYILLNWIYDHRADYDDPLGVVEYIYDDFDFPTSMKDFVRYLPMHECNLGSIEQNTNRLYGYWVHFLCEQEKTWKKA